MHNFRQQSDASLSAIHQLQVENQQLRNQLDQFIVQAKKNERKLRRIQNQEHKLISARSLYELLDNLINQYRYSATLDVVSLCLIDPEYEIQRMLNESGVDFKEETGLMFFSDDQVLVPLFHQGRRPILGSFNAARHGVVFPSAQRSIRNIALLPLYHQGRLVGSLNLGSRQADRFLQSDGTEFLERLAAIFPLCLENTLNQERLKKVGLTDPLTGVNNRRFFDQRLEEEILRSQRAQSPLCCLFVDLDKFKPVNDTYGHQSGDRVLIQTAALIRQQLRLTDVLGRYGGEEFSILLSETGLEEAREIAERIRATIAEHLFELADGNTLNLTLSIGVACYAGASGTVEECGAQLVSQADEAVYEAKRGGRNRVVVRQNRDETR